MNKNVHMVKLINGELLIGVLTIGDDAYVLHRAYQVAIVPNPDTGQDGLAFLDFNGHFTDEKDLRIPTRSVLYSLKANNHMQQLYLERDSNIILPPNDLANLAE